MGDYRFPRTRISFWNKKQLLWYFNFFLDMCYRKESDASAYVDEWRQFFERSVQEIWEDLLIGEERKSSTTIRMLTESQSIKKNKLYKLEQNFYKKWINTKFQDLFFTKSYYYGIDCIERCQYDSFTKDGKPIYNKLWLEFVEEFGMTPVDEVERYFSDDPAVRRKVARKKRGKDYSAKK